MTYHFLIDYNFYAGAGWVVARMLYLYGYAMHGPQYRLVGGALAHCFDFPMYVGLFFTGYYLLPDGLGVMGY